MGWLYSCDTNFTRQDQIAKFRSPDYWSKDVKLLADRVVGNHYWAAIQVADGRKMVFLAIMASGGKEMGWGYKDMDETMGPYYYDCPLSLLDMTDEPTDGHAVEWRAKVRAHHAAKKSRPKPATGMVVSYGGHDYVLGTNLGRRGWSVRRCSDWAGFRMPLKHLSQAVFKASAADGSAAPAGASAGA